MQYRVFGLLSTHMHTERKGDCCKMLEQFDKCLTTINTESQSHAGTQVRGYIATNVADVKTMTPQAYCVHSSSVKTKHWFHHSLQLRQ